MIDMTQFPDQENELNPEENENDSENPDNSSGQDNDEWSDIVNNQVQESDEKQESHDEKNDSTHPDEKNPLWEFLDWAIKIGIISFGIYFLLDSDDEKAKKEIIQDIRKQFSFLKIERLFKDFTSLKISTIKISQGEEDNLDLKYYEDNALEDAMYFAKEVDNFGLTFSDLHHFVTKALPLVFQEEYELSNDSGTDLILKAQLLFQKFYLNQIVDYYIKTNSDLISSRRGAVVFLYDHYQKALTSEDRQLDLLPSFLSSEGHISKQTSDRFTEKILEMLKEKIDIADAADQEIEKENDNESSKLSATQIGLLAHYMERRNLLATHDTVNLAKILSKLTGKSKENIEDVLPYSKAEDKKYKAGSYEPSRPLLILKSEIEELLKLIDKDIEKIGYRKF